MMSKKGVVFFDIDDTLVETSRFNKDAVNYSLHILEENSINISEKEQQKVYDDIYQSYKADNDILVHFMRKLYVKYSTKFKDLNQAKSLGELAKAKYESFRTEMYKHYMPEFTKNTISKFYTSGYDIGIISQGTPSMQKRKLDCLDIGEFVNPDLIFLTKKKTFEFYEEIKNKVYGMYGNLELIMVGDREDLDVLLPQELDYKVYRVLGTGKYNTVKTTDSYECFKNFKELNKKLDDILDI